MKMVKRVHVWYSHVLVNVFLSFVDDVANSCPGNLWYRQGVTPSYPQGSSWEHISNNVRKVSVGPLDQVSTSKPSKTLRKKIPL